MLAHVPAPSPTATVAPRGSPTPDTSGADYYTRSRYEWKGNRFRRIDQLEVLPAEGHGSMLVRPPSQNRDLSHDTNLWFVPRCAAEGEGDEEGAFGFDGVGEFYDDLGEVEARDFADVFDNERVDVVLGVFELDHDG